MTRKVKGTGVVRLGVFGNLSAVSSARRKNRENYNSDDATHKSEMRTMQIEPAEMRGPTDDSGRRERAQPRNDADAKRESQDERVIHGGEGITGRESRTDSKNN